MSDTKIPPPYEKHEPHEPEGLPGSNDGPVPVLDHETQEGVRKVEALQAVWGPWSKVALWIAIALASYMYVLDNGTNWAWGSYASSALGHYEQFAAIQCAMAILLAIGKPLFAKFTDVIGRAEAIALALFFYVLGYIISAAAPTMTGLGAGNCIWELGFSGLQIALQIVIADITTLRWRPIISQMSSGGWYFINFYANAKISDRIVKGPGWRWGYGIYALCYLPALIPIIVVLLWAQRKAKKRGIVYQEKLEGATVGQRFLKFVEDIDAVGLFLLTATLALVFLPIVIAGGAGQSGQYVTTTWDDPAIPAMMVVGGVVVFPAFVYWEAKRATHPVFPWRLLRNRTVLAGVVVNFFDFISFYLTFNQLYGFIAATTNWGYQDIIYYTNAQSLSLTFFAILWGIFAGWFKIGYKWSLVCALGVRIIGVGLMLHARQGRENIGELVMTQILQGAGGGIAAVTSQIGAQGAVPHQDVALATAAVLLAAELGNVVGTAGAGAIWKNRLPIEIAKNLPFLNATEIGDFVGMPANAQIKYHDLNDLNRVALHNAFSATMRLMLIPALVLAFLPFIAAFFVKDFKLKAVQNAVEVKTLDGTRLEGESLEPELVKETVNEGKRENKATV